MVLYGFQFSESCSISSLVWISNNSLIVLTTAISPSGIISGDCNANIRYTSIVQWPIPLILMSSFRTSSADFVSKLSKFNSSETALDNVFRYRIFCRLTPQLFKSSSGHSMIVSGETLPKRFSIF